MCTNRQHIAGNVPVSAHCGTAGVTGSDAQITDVNFPTSRLPIVHLSVLAQPSPGRGFFAS